MKRMNMRKIREVFRLKFDLKLPNSKIGWRKLINRLIHKGEIEKVKLGFLLLDILM
jgi:hypothetical protein